MDTLYENLLSLCREKGITGGKMCTDIGLSKSLMTGLKKGRRSSISTETAQKIAEYFGVSVDRVLGSDQKEKSPAPKGVELNPNYFNLSADNRALIDSMIEKLIKSQSEN